MTVETFNPQAKTPVQFTEKAMSHLSKQVNNHSAHGITFNVKESGCSGFKYLLELATELDLQANTYQLTNDLTLFVRPDIIELIRGTEVDYIQEGVNHRLDFQNPNATASCGCGESFSVEKQA